MTDHNRLTLRLHYPALRNAQASVGDLIDVITLFMAHFSLPRKQVEAVYAQKDQLDGFAFHTAATRLNHEAVSLFKRVRSVSNSGEAGELLLFLLTEWIIGAPQIIAKMSLKTNPQMPVHGSDGIHVKFVPKTGKLLFYSGEAKLYSRIDRAIASAAKSIAEGLDHEKAKHELELVRRNVSFAGLNGEAEAALLKYLDPMEEAYNDRVDVVTCLIGFDFAGYGDLGSHKDPRARFEAVVVEHLAEVGPKIAAALTRAGLSQQRVEMFLLPVPSVEDLRTRFQDYIGWGRP
ncbi:DUF1837 domain-containing protein [Brevundimonas naejangsanensis]|uniref:HamA C-terminal domain-containing protein n=1 Tax=Brevundimonas naejangsanensis TaxID=588932 RepID=UPI0032097705